jgi:hypothetical protein
MSTATLESPVNTTVVLKKFQPLDIYGKPIVVGDNVVYATRRGSETLLNKLVVSRVGVNSIQGWSPDDVNRRMKTLKSFATIAKVS